MSFGQISVKPKRLSDSIALNHAQNRKHLSFHDCWNELPDGPAIRSHVGLVPIELTWPQLANVIRALRDRLNHVGIRSGSKVLLQAAPGQCELYALLLLNALAFNRCQTIFPMVSLGEDKEGWYKRLAQSGLDWDTELLPLQLSIYRPRPVTDRPLVRSVSPETLLQTDLSSFIASCLEDDPIVEPSLGRDLAHRGSGIDENREDLLISTSGSSGKQKFVAYNWQAFLRSAESWQKAGLFASDQFGGPGLTLLLAHTMGLRTWVNALYSKQAFCLIDPSLLEIEPTVAGEMISTMRPAHLTGGPALFGGLLDLGRYLPGLDHQLGASLQRVVMSGASWSDRMANRIRNAWGLEPQNAFGTSETLQVMATRGNQTVRGELGEPLPGVELQLEPHANGLYQLGVASPFRGATIYHLDAVPESIPSPVFLGDLVSQSAEGTLVHCGRLSNDFVKDAFGFKVQLKRFRNYLAELDDGGVGLVGMKEKPGLVLWVATASLDSEVVQADLDRWVLRAEAINHYVDRDVDTLEARHYRIARVAMLRTEIPLTKKGTVHRGRLSERLSAQLDSIGFANYRSDAHAELPAKEAEQHSASSSNRRIASLLQGLRMDCSVIGGQRDWVELSGHPGESFLDCVGGFGVNLLGHNHPEVKQAAIDFLRSSKVALCDQATVQQESARLTHELGQMLFEETGRKYRVLLANGGAEAVDLSLRHAFLRWQERCESQYRSELFRIQKHRPDLLQEFDERWQAAIPLIKPAVITLDGAYHGNSLSGLALSGASEKRQLFGPITAFDVLLLNSSSPEWAAELNAIESETQVCLPGLRRIGGQWKLTDVHLSRLIGAIAEPVRGEGGVTVRREQMLQVLSRLPCPLILDSIQCGLGRCESLLGTEVTGDTVLFAKALGGGVAKVAAVAVSQNQWVTELDKYSSNTFGNGALDATVARKTLALIQSENVVAKSKAIGTQIQAMLGRLQRKFPDWLAEPQGKGLMWGISFRFDQHLDDFFCSLLHRGNFSGYLLSAWLFHRCQIRILPTLSANETLRLEPSVYFGEHELSVLESALERLCGVLQRKDWRELCLPLVWDDPWEGSGGSSVGREPKQASESQLLAPSSATGNNAAEENVKPIDLRMEPPAETATRIGFLAHYLHGETELRRWVPALRTLSSPSLISLFHKLAGMGEQKAIPMMAKNLHHGSVWLKSVSLSTDVATLEGNLDASLRKRLLKELQHAVDQLAAEGCRYVALGAFTSIISANGLKLREPIGCRIVTGNTLTAANAMHRVLPLMRPEKTLAVIGGSGNVGTALVASLLSQPDCFGNINVIGRQVTPPAKMSELLQRYESHGLRYRSHLSTVAGADVIVCLASASSPVLHPHHIDTATRVDILDLSVPSGVSPAVFHLANVHSMVAHPGIELPADRDAELSPLLPAGAIYCCAAEAILCGLASNDAPMNPAWLRGDVCIEQVEQFRRLAMSQGFFE